MIRLEDVDLDELLSELCRKRRNAESLPKFTQMSKADYAIYRTMRQLGILEDIDYSLLPPSMIGACGDNRMFWEGTDRLRSKSEHDDLPFPLARPGGSIFANPTVARGLRIDDHNSMARDVKATYAARGLNEYVDKRHWECGVAGILQLTLPELIYQSFELNDWLEERVGDTIPDFKTHSLLHLNLYGYAEGNQGGMMRHYRVHPALFFEWWGDGSPVMEIRGA